MNFHQLNIFYAVAEKGGFSAAAQALHLSQPAVTMQMQALEDYFGAKLFDRSSKKITLTEAGETLLPFALRSIELMRDTGEAMSTYTRMLEGRLLLGSSLTIGEYVLPPLLGPFGKAYPDISITMKVMNTTQILDEIAKRQLNFGLIEAPLDLPDMIVEPVLGDELKLIVPAGHPLDRPGPVHLSEALGYPFVLRERGSGTRRVMEQALAERGRDPQEMEIVMELGSTGAVKSAVEAGLGVTIISADSVKHEAALGLLKIVDLADAAFERQFYAVHPKSALLPISAVTFLAYLRKYDKGTGISKEGGNT